MTEAVVLFGVATMLVVREVVSILVARRRNRPKRRTNPNGQGDKMGDMCVDFFRMSLRDANRETHDLLHRIISLLEQHRGPD